MMKIVFIFLVFLMGCDAPAKIINVTLTNKSDFPIDSVMIYPTMYYNKSKASKLQFKFAMDPKVAEGGSVIYVFSNNKKFGKTCCDWDWNTFMKKEEIVYLFNNGISDDSLEIKKPDIFNIYISLNKGQIVDSIYADVPVLKYYKTDRYINLEFNYDTIAAVPRLNIVSNKKVQQYTIDNDWANWNIDQRMLRIQDGRLVDNI